MALDLADEFFHFVFLRLAGGVVVGGDGDAVGGDVPLAFLEGRREIGVERETVYKRISLFYIDVDVGESFEFRVIFIISVFEEFYPEAEAADFDGVGVQVHAKEAAFDEGLFFVKQGLLHAAAFGRGGFVFKEGAGFIGDDEFVIGDFDVVFLQAPAGAVAKDAQFVLDGDEFIKGGDEKMAGADGGVADFQGVYYFIGLCNVVYLVIKFAEIPACPVFLFVELLDDSAAESFSAYIHRDIAGGEKGTILVAI